MVYKNLISTESQEDAPSNICSPPKEMSVTDQDLSVRSHSRQDQSPCCVGMPPNRINVRVLNESEITSSSKRENDPEKEKKDDGNDVEENDQLSEDSRERRSRCLEDLNFMSAPHNNHNKLGDFILKSGILQEDERQSMKSSSTNPSLDELKLGLQLSDESHPSDRLHQKQLGMKSTTAESLDEPSFDTKRCDEILELPQDEEADSNPFPNEQHESESDYDHLTIEEHPSADSVCSITEKWKMLMEGDGYTPPVLERPPSDDVGLDEYLSFRLSGESESSFQPLLRLAEKTIGADKVTQKEEYISSDDIRKLGTIRNRELKHAIPEPKTLSEATVGAEQSETMTSLYRFIDKIFTRCESAISPESESSHSTESQMNRARHNKTKPKKKNKKGRKRVTFDDEAPFLSPETFSCERLMLIYC